MASASAIRFQIEAALAHRIPSALTPIARAVRPVAPTGVAAVDELLAGGLPVGAIAEFVGAECSGRTALALSFVACITRAGRVAAWIDVSDGLDPESAAAAGVDLKRLLWVRCGVAVPAEQRLPEKNFRLPQKYLAPAAVKKGLHGGGFGPHPRTESHGMAGAVSGLLRRQAPGWATPELSPRKDRETVVQAAAQPAAKYTRRVRAGKPWERLEQGLRAADLLLQAGGFAAVVLDLGSLAAEYATRVPMATWFRYRAAAERAQASLLVLAQHACAKSSAELLLRFAPGQVRDEQTVFTGMDYAVEMERRRFTPSAAPVVSLRKPPQREIGARWRSRPEWAGAR